MLQITKLELRRIKKVYKSALCSQCNFHLPILTSKLTNELKQLTPNDSLEEYRIDQLMKSLSNLKIKNR
jgi:hypothetical protein